MPYSVPHSRLSVTRTPDYSRAPHSRLHRGRFPSVELPCSLADVVSNRIYTAHRAPCNGPRLPRPCGRRRTKPR